MILLGTPAALNAGIWGMPKFEMKQSDDRFATDRMTTWNGRWNRISKRAIGGGRHIDSKGVFFEPFALLSRADGKLKELGFLFENSYWRDTLVGAPLDIGTPLRVSFLTGEGDPIVLEIKKPEHQAPEVPRCDRVTLTCSGDESDVGTIDLTLEQYVRIMNAPALATKIEGSKRQWIYETKDIDPAFRENLQRFHKEHIASAL